MTWNPWDRTKDRQAGKTPLSFPSAIGRGAGGEGIKPKPAGPNPPAAHDEMAPYEELIKQALAVMAPMEDLKERARHKEQVLKELMPWVDGWLARGTVYPNPAAVRAMIWLFDIGDTARALPLALALIRQKVQRLPHGFDRDLPTFVSDCVYDWANQRLQACETAAPHLGDWIAACERENWSLHPIVLGKLHALMAKHAARWAEAEDSDREDWNQVIDWCRKAELANPRAGVTKLKEKALAKLTGFGTTNV